MHLTKKAKKKLENLKKQIKSNPHLKRKTKKYLV